MDDKKLSETMDRMTNRIVLQVSLAMLLMIGLVASGFWLGWVAALR